MKIKLKCISKDLACSTYMTRYLPCMINEFDKPMRKLAELIQCICIVPEQIYLALY